MLNSPEPSKQHTRVICLGVKTINLSNEELEACLTLADKLIYDYSFEELEEINKTLHLEIADYFHFIDKQTYGQKRTSTAHIQYRYAGSTRVSSDELESSFIMNINPYKFYTMDDIRQLSSEIGCNVWSRNYFVEATILQYNFNRGELYNCVQSVKKLEKELED